MLYKGLYTNKIINYIYALHRSKSELITFLGYMEGKCSNI